MNVSRYFKAVAFAAITTVLLASGANAATVTYNTNSPLTQFSAGGLLLTSDSGAVATLTFSTVGDTVTGVPSNVNFGIFNLSCNACSTQAGGVGATFNPFSFSLVVRDVVNVAEGTFTGSSVGGTVYSDTSPVVIFWSPAQLGPGTLNAGVGNFVDTVITAPVTTGIVAPNSGAVPGQTTVEGFVIAPSSEIPEPMTLGMVGAALIGVGLLRRKR